MPVSLRLVVWFLLIISIELSSLTEIAVCRNSSSKSEPSPENLGDECSPWSSLSCCNATDVEKIHSQTDLFPYLGQHTNQLSSDCQRYFARAQCFHACEPHIGPWIEVTSSQTKDEKNMSSSMSEKSLRGVPICNTECDEWFSKCRSDKICDVNLNRKCEASKTFSVLYHNSSNFCNNIFNGTFVYTLSKDSCMKLWFPKTNGINPNMATALHYLKLKSANSKSQSVIPSIIILTIGLILIAL